MNSKKIAAGILAALTLLTVPNISAFSDTSTSLTVSAATSVCTMWVKDNNGNYLQCSLYDDKRAEVISGEVNGKTLSVPATVTYKNETYKITRIKNNAFKNSGVKKVDLRSSSNLSYIGEYAFAGSSVESVILGNAQNTVLAHAFQNCKSLTSVNMSNSRVTYIKGSTFEGCTKLTNVTFPSTLTGFEAASFSNTGLTSVVIPKNVTSIQYHAFYNNANLEKVEFAASENNQYELTLYSESFTKCPKLKSVVFNRSKFNAAIDVFTNESKTESINKDVVMTGYGYYGDGTPAGINSYVDSVCKKLLKKWNITYNRNGSEADKKAAISKLAKCINEYLATGDIKEEGNAATVLSVRQTTCGGFARTFYHCARLMGMTEKEVLIGGDAHCHAWNYIKNNGKWYVVDVGWGRGAGQYVFTDSQYKSKVLDTFDNGKGKNVTQHQPKNWIVCNYSFTGASDELNYENPTVRDYYTDYLNRNKLGTRAN